MECLCTTGGNVNWYSHFKKQHGVSFKKKNKKLPVQDGRVEGHVLISSCKRTKIATSIDRRTMEPTKKDISRPKKKKLQQDGRRGTNIIKSNPISVRWWPTNWRTITSKMFSHSCEGSKPHVRLPSLGSWQRDWESPGNLTVKASRLWLQDSHRTGKQRPHCWRAQTKSCVLQDPEERSSDPTGDWTRPTTTVGGSPMEVGVSSGSSWGQGHWPQQSWKMPLV